MYPYKKSPGIATHLEPAEAEREQHLNVMVISIPLTQLADCKQVA